MSSIMKGLVDEDGGEEVHVVYVNGKPQTKSKNSAEAQDHIDIMKRKFPRKNYEIKQEVREDPNDPEIAILGGGGTVSLSMLKKKAAGEARQLADDLAAGKFIPSAHNVKQLVNTLETLKKALSAPEGETIHEGPADPNAKRLTVKKHGGNDDHSWAIFVDGRPAVTGLNKRSVAHYKTVILKKLAEKPGLTGSGMMDEGANDVEYLVKNRAGKEKAFKLANSWEAQKWKDDTTPKNKPKAAASGLNRQQAGQQRSQQYQSLVQNLATELMVWAGNNFPDGDPHDDMMEYFHRKRWSDADAQKVLRAALKTINPRYTSYGDYLADMWDDFAADNPDMMQDGNPWRPIREELNQENSIMKGLRR